MPPRKKDKQKGKEKEKEVIPVDTDHQTDFLSFNGELSDDVHFHEAGGGPSGSFERPAATYQH